VGVHEASSDHDASSGDARVDINPTREEIPMKTRARACTFVTATFTAVILLTAIIIPAVASATPKPETKTERLERWRLQAAVDNRVVAEIRKSDVSRLFTIAALNNRNLEAFDRGWTADIVNSSDADVERVPEYTFDPNYNMITTYYDEYHAFMNYNTHCTGWTYIPIGSLWSKQRRAALRAALRDGRIPVLVARVTSNWRVYQALASRARALGGTGYARVTVNNTCTVADFDIALRQLVG
jgi:hypothetical protein